MTHACPNCNGGLAKTPLKLRNGWVIMSHNFTRMQLIINLLSSMQVDLCSQKNIGVTGPWQGNGQRNIFIVTVSANSRVSFGGQEMRTDRLISQNNQVWSGLLLINLLGGGKWNEMTGITRQFAPTQNHRICAAEIYFYAHNLHKDVL